ncbi:hypothetical protein GOODEAATRI_025100, partial [Goodea atripinnis]
VRPLSDGSNPWSTSLLKSQKSVPLAALFGEQAGAGRDETFPQECSDGSSKPKQLKFPNQVYIDLPLWRDEMQPQSPGGNGGSGDAGVGPGGPPDMPDDPYTTTSTSSTSTTPQLTPTNSLKRPSGRRKTDFALYGCGSLLASVVLGYDIREAIKSSAPPEDCEPPKEEKEKKKKEGLFQRAARFRRSTSPPGGRSRKEETSSNPTSTPPVNLVSMSAIMECNSTKCLLQPEPEVLESSPGKVEPPPEQSNHKTGTRLRRKKYTTNHNTHNGPSAPPAAQKKQEKEKDEKPLSGDPVPRPRPVSFRTKPHAWALLRGRNKSYSLGHYSGEKTAQDLNVGCSLLDMDTEGQKRDCTVPLCRIQSSPGRPSVFELEKEFLS